MRADARPADLRVLWAGTARMLAADGVDDPAEWRRYAALGRRRAARLSRQPARALEHGVEHRRRQHAR